MKVTTKKKEKYVILFLKDIKNEPKPIDEHQLG
jgi:hypothetical protein